jgi:hypothetical protein
MIARVLKPSDFTNTRSTDQCRICDDHLRLAALIDQPRFECSLHAGSFSRRCSDVYIVSDFYRLRRAEEDTR